MLTNVILIFIKISIRNKNLTMIIWSNLKPNLRYLFLLFHFIFFVIEIDISYFLHCAMSRFRTKIVFVVKRAETTKPWRIDTCALRCGHSSRIEDHLAAPTNRRTTEAYFTPNERSNARSAPLRCFASGRSCRIRWMNRSTCMTEPWKRIHDSRFVSFYKFNSFNFSMWFDLRFHSSAIIFNDNDETGILLLYRMILWSYNLGYRESNRRCSVFK